MKGVRGHTAQNDKVIDTLLRVPNTDEGRAFLKQLRSYAITGTRVITNGRGPRTRPALAAGRWKRSFDQRIPLKHATYFAVCINKPALEKILSDKNRQYVAELHTEIANLRIAAGANPEKVRDELKIELANINAKRRITL